ncbi:ERAD-associated protein [Orbilia ellipsospora]|uniref:ERAD-associated protein n=1 Tax=Orbilia ellipsospora TaxID=2528407 RepID=A0AAV9XCL0_9PEZI
MKFGVRILVLPCVVLPRQWLDLIPSQPPSTSPYIDIITLPPIYTTAIYNGMMAEPSTPTRESRIPATSPYGSPEPLSDLPQPLSPGSPLHQIDPHEFPVSSSFAGEMVSSAPKQDEQEEDLYDKQSGTRKHFSIESQSTVVLPSGSSQMHELELSPVKLDILDPVQENENLELTAPLDDTPAEIEDDDIIPTLPTIAESPPRPSSPNEATAPPSSPPRIPSPPSSIATTPSIPAIKRRRLNSSATSKLTRPFKSPLKVNNAVHNRATSSGATPRKYPPSTPPRKTAAPYTPLRPIYKDVEETEETEEFSPIKSAPLPPVNKRPITSTPKSSNPPFRSSFRGTTRLNLSSPASNSTKDPYILSLEKKHMQLKKAVEEAKKRLEESAQALRIEESGEDPKLEELIVKWRQAAQSAADHMFSGAEQRFARMGGMAAYREMQTRRSGGGWGFADEDPEEGLTEDQKEARRQAMYEAGFDELSELEKSQTQVKNKALKDDGDQFTMEMMLKSLNIDIDIMGYDKTTQGWVK